MIEALSHITFIVKDLNKATDFFRTIFNAEEIYDSFGKNYSLSREKFFRIGDLWIVAMEGSPLKERSYNHVAFKISESEFEEYLLRIQKLGLEIKPPRPRVDGEARSVYFYDFDNHLFELHTGTLEERMKKYSNNE
ncbi:MAG: FosX/FosE/FosI family fosfomycin resistance thiol transferase [Candidatus Riflebacteria bacterium]|nr:FosX/FosE/FosI family fosfomycin resistance thiol transferase [Candidatus Riflebacteria bacterium]